MRNKVSSTVIATRVLDQGELESLMAQIGGFLIARGFTPLAHAQRLLDYALETRRGHRKETVLVQVTDLPIDFTAEDGSSLRIAAAYAFGVAAPSTMLPAITDLIAPFQIELAEASANSGQLLRGKKFEKKVPGVACDHCGFVQEVTVPIEVERVEGARGYGPGGRTSVVCSNCGKPFEVTWDNVIVEIDITQ
jgi:DNA-directed RNA polymerase subunit RPC12/RpoP